MSNTFCVLPWLHLASHPHGGITLCCNANHEHGVSRSRNKTSYSDDDPKSTKGDQFLDLKNQSIQEIMNGDTFKEVRLQMLSGKKPYACLRCYKEESLGIVSKRVKENNEYPHFTVDVARTLTSPDGTIANINLEFVELRLGNICNVKCRTCNPWSSSKWISDYQKLREEYPDLGEFNKDHNQFDWPEQEKFWEDLFDRTQDAKVFYINGGEPTLIKEHFKFLQRMIDAGRTNVCLRYNINMTNMNEEIIEIWKQFDDIDIGFSIDDLEERNEYIRNPTKWDDVIKTMDMLLPHRNEIKFSITQTVSWMNFPYLGEFYEWATAHGIYVHHNMVNDPKVFSPNVLPLEYRKDVINRFSNILPEDKINALRQFEQHETDIELIKRAMNYTDSLDRMRRENFDDVFPELSFLREYK